MLQFADVLLKNGVQDHITIAFNASIRQFMWPVYFNRLSEVRCP